MMKFMDTTTKRSDLWHVLQRPFFMQVKAGSCLKSFELNLQPAGVLFTVLSAIANLFFSNVPNAFWSGIAEQR